MALFPSITNSLSSAFLVAKNSWSVGITNFSPSALVSKFIGNSYRPVGWGSLTDQDAKSTLYMKALPNISELQTGDVEYGYFFDAFVVESHTGSVRITDHPVQTGATISDHAYNIPDKLTLQIFVSDSMDCVVTNQFSKASTKSISAYQVLRDLKTKRLPLSVRTRLYHYKNMLIESMSVNDDYKTANSLRCTVMLREIIMADVNAQTVNKSYGHVDEKTTENAAPKYTFKEGSIGSKTQHQ